jgi:hypothetical protein
MYFAEVPLSIASRRPRTCSVMNLIFLETAAMAET